MKLIVQSRKKKDSKAILIYAYHSMELIQITIRIINYYNQPTIESVCPTTTPNKGKVKIIVHRKGLRYNFRSSNLGCKVDNNLGK